MLKRKKTSKTKKNVLKFIKISKKGYGKNLMGLKVYYEGPRPKLLKDDGSFLFGKNIFEFLTNEFKKFRLIISNKKSRIEGVGSSKYVYLSTADLNLMQSMLIDRNRDLKQRVITKKFSELFPDYFRNDTRLFSYEKGMFDGILTKEFMPSLLSTDDRKSLNAFIPRFIASGVAGRDKNLSGKIKSSVEMEILKGIANDLEKRIASDKSESTWQDYLRSNILHIQQGYIAFIDKANIGVINTQFPDFLLVTHDGYLDILEIKTPGTILLNEDKSRGNYYWTPELSKAIAQTENYIDEVYSLRDKIKNEIKDRYGIDLRVVRPRGVILAGDTSQFLHNKKVSDDFRLLSQSLKNISFVTYDELLVRLQNYIAVLTELKSV